MTLFRGKTQQSRGLSFHCNEQFHLLPTRVHLRLPSPVVSRCTSPAVQAGIIRADVAVLKNRCERRSNRQMAPGDTTVGRTPFRTGGRAFGQPPTREAERPTPRVRTRAGGGTFSPIKKHGVCAADVAGQARGLAPGGLGNGRIQLAGSERAGRAPGQPARSGDHSVGALRYARGWGRGVL